MQKHTPNLGVVLATLVLGAPVAPSILAQEAADAATAVGIELADCQIAPARSPSRLAARCGSLLVPEDPANPDGDMIELRIAVIPAMTRDAQPDPLVYVAGGPGQSSVDSFTRAVGAFRAIQRERDIVLVDQRGTGGSNRLHCGLTDVGEDGAALDSSDAFAPAAIEACLDSLPADTRFYSTSVAVQDLELVREALGYASWNIYGISYGTRVAQHYLRRYPEHTRSLILDGVVPPTLPLGPRISLDAQAALDTAFQRCADDVACNERFPDLAQSFDELSARLDRDPQQVTIADPLTAENITVTLDDDGLGAATRLLSYMPETVSLLPLLIHTAAIDGDLRPLAAQAQLVISEISEEIAIGMHNSVVCTEDAPFYDTAVTQRADMENTYLGALQYDAINEICATWPAGVMDEDFNDPLVSDVPVLLLSGEADPVTPPSNATLAAEALSRSRSLVGIGQGHGIAGRGCVPILISRFITDADPEGLDAECLQRMRPAPFFTSFVGPEP
jgi:pimeloyl-ACP methyl ester carboxylesterase